MNRVKDGALIVVSVLALALLVNSCSSGERKRTESVKQDGYEEGYRDGHYDGYTEALIKYGIEE